MEPEQEFTGARGRRVRARMMALLTDALRPPREDGPAGSREPMPVRACRAFVAATGAAGGAITLAPAQLYRMTLCATDDVAARLENLQEVIGQGPVIDAAATDAPVGLDAEEAGRWAELMAAIAEELDAVAMWAFPMRVAGQTPGVVSVYRPAARGAWRPPLREASFMANAIGAAIVSADLDADAAVAWHVKDRINQSIGMVIGQLGISPADATALLRAAAFSAGTDLPGIAGEIIERRRDFSQDRDGQGGHE